MSRRQVRKVSFDPSVLRAARLRAGLTQENLAREIDVTLRTVMRWEAGDSAPYGSNLLTLCEALGAEPDDFYVTAAAEGVAA